MVIAATPKISCGVVPAHSGDPPRARFEFADAGEPALSSLIDAFLARLRDKLSNLIQIKVYTQLRP
ncbi:MAG TPA: hypothetical protein VME45_00270 [Stellaceae bacterium]|nr:hypothetical protein [Stellaceae bacterium]